MKLINYISAYTALGVLAKLPLPAPTAYAVYKLRLAIAPKAEYFTREEHKLAEQYGARRADGKLDIREGRVVMRGDTDEERNKAAAEYIAKRDELCRVEDSDVIPRPVIRLPREAVIAPEMLEALDGFAVIEVDGDE